MRSVQQTAQSSSAATSGAAHGRCLDPRRCGIGVIAGLTQRGFTERRLILPIGSRVVEAHFGEVVVTPLRKRRSSHADRFQAFQQLLVLLRFNQE